jgi:hypothetical protein
MGTARMEGRVALRARMRVVVVLKVFIFALMM